MKELPLKSKHLVDGAQLEERNGCEVVGDYGQLEAEVHATNNEATLIDFSDSEVYRAEGRDRSRFLHGMVSNEVSKLEAGQGNYALLLTPQGKFIADLHLFVIEDQILLSLDQPGAQLAMSTLDRYLIADKVTFTPASDDLRILTLQGPGANRLLESVFASQSLPVANHGHLVIESEKLSAQLCRVDRSGQGGFDLIVPVAQLELVWNLLVEAGAKPAGRRALDIVRVERGLPTPGRELTDRTIPLEAGEAFEALSISHEKGCYTGQEVICRAKTRGRINWMLTAFALPMEARQGDRLFKPAKESVAGASDSANLDETGSIGAAPPPKEMGWITSAVNSPTRGRIGLGYVHRNVRRIGESLVVGAPDGAIKAKLLPLPR